MMNHPESFHLLRTDHQEFLRIIHQCPILGSLRRINQSLMDLTREPDCHAVQIAEVIRQDPSLTTRLLRLVNSVFAGLRTPVTSLESAVFYLGLSGIRHLAITSKFVEELNSLSGENGETDWVRLWRHSISTAYFTREILSLYGTSSTDDLDYLVGLLHNVGKIVMAHAFKAEFEQTLTWTAPTTALFALKEKTTFGWDHAEVGAEYLRMHNLNEAVISAVCWHNQPGNAGDNAHYAAAVQVADCLAQYAGVQSGVETLDPVANGDWIRLPGWRILFSDDSSKNRLARAALDANIQRLPGFLEAMSPSIPVRQ